METDTDKFNLDEEKMIILITGASHTGKTLLAQKMLEKYKYPYLSLDDGGKSVCFNAFVYNVQPGIVIDYVTGESHAE